MYSLLSSLFYFCRSSNPNEPFNTRDLKLSDSTTSLQLEVINDRMKSVSYHGDIKNITDKSIFECVYKPSSYREAIYNGNHLDFIKNNTPNFNEQYSHCGLIQYIHLCWAKEKGVILRPDMIYSTILSELVGLVVDNPEKYRSLYTDSQGKKNLVIAYPNTDDITVIPKMFGNELLEAMPNNGFAKSVSSVDFKSAPKYFKECMFIKLAEGGTPFYNYCTTRCGIPRVGIIGDVNEWNHLLSHIDVFASLFADQSKYFGDCKEIINKIINSLKTNGNSDFLLDIFTYNRRGSVQSGQEPLYITGWIQNFYLDKYSNIARYPNHINYLPHHNIDTGIYKYHAGGLAASEDTGDYLYPMYKIVVHQLTNPSKDINDKIFNKIAKK